MSELPGWASELKTRYVRGEASQFILYGNVHDIVLHEGKTYPADEFLSAVMLGPNKDTILTYNNSTGVKFVKQKGKLDGLDDLLLHRSRDKVLPVLERLLVTQDRFALIMQYAETLAPNSDLSMYSEGDRAALVTLHRWASLPALEHSDNLVIMLTENLSELHQRLVNNARVSTIRVPLPETAERQTFVKFLNPKLDEASVTRLAEITAGLKLVQIRSILSPEDAADDIEARKKYIQALLGTEGSPERVDGLARITKGMSQQEMHQLIAPNKSLPQPEGNGVSTEIERLIFKQKRNIIERECAGLLEFIEPKHDFGAVGGMDEVKRELNRVAAAIRGGETARVPMGFLFVGPMGTGKTFVAEAFAKESGLTAVKFGSFRSKWVGATEANLERILDVLAGMGQVIVVIDEVDRALAGNDGSGDGGTESRVIARLKEFMSDSQNRGRILFILMTNRPDLLDTDIKRTGRLDRKIPFFYSQTAEEVQPILNALIKRHKLKLDAATLHDEVAGKLVGYSNADLEGVVLLAASIADSAGRRDTPTLDDMKQAVADYLPSRDVTMLEYMELLAVYEASNKSMLPVKYRKLGPQELSERLGAARLRVGHRR